MNNKNGNNDKSEDKDNTNTSTVGVHVGEAALDQDKTGASRNKSSIGAYVFDVTGTIITSM